MLETKRLILRKVKYEDLDDLFYNWGSDSKTNEYLTFALHKTKEDTKKMIDFWINKSEKRGYEWVIELKDTHTVIGVISADKSYKYKCYEIGYSIGSKYFNLGYTSEGVNRVIEFLFDECDCSVIEAIIPSNNLASISVANKCGLTKEATLKNRYMNKVSNEINDLYIYSRFKGA